MYRMCKLAGCPIFRVSGLNLNRAVWLLAVLLAGLAPLASAVPYFGDEVFTYHQPDGSSFGVRLYGDEFFAYQRTADDSREVVLDEATGFWCYAKLAPDGCSFISTGVPVVTIEKSSDSSNKALAVSAGAAQPLETLPYDVILERVEQSKAVLGAPVLETLTQAVGDKMAPPLTKVEGDIIGLCILVDFPDDEATISQAEVGRFLNQTTDYTEFGNACSVNEYFHIQSNGKLNYTNIVTPWVRMPHPKIYYDDNSLESAKPSQLVNTALDILASQGFDFTGISAINIYYAGYCYSGWRRGLWPHSAGWYQMTSMGDKPTLGTFCHENGHMICGFPDLYSYTASYLGTSGSIVSDYCLMCAGGGTHPPNFSPVLKDNAGWADVVEVGYDSSPQHALLQADRNRFYKYANPDRPTEYFMLENRNASGYEGPYGGAGPSAPGSGLVIWHVDKTGSNMYSSIQNPLIEEEELFSIPYYAFIVEAEPSGDALWYGNPAPAPNAADTFYAGHGANPVYSHPPLPVNPMFGITDPADPEKVFLSHPDLCFWNREDLGAGRTVISNLVVHSFGEQGHYMPFIIGVNKNGTADWQVFGVTGTPKIAMTCSSIAARCNWGQNPPSQNFRVFNAGGQMALFFTVESDQPWLKVSPTSNYALPGLGGEAIEVSFDATGLASGTHLGTITVFAPDQVPANPLYIGVTLKVGERPLLQVTPPTITVSLDPSEESSDQHIVVKNAGGSTMKYTVTSSCPGSPWNWLEPAATSGTCIGGMQDAVYLNISPRNESMSPVVLPAGLHTGTVTVTAGGALGSPATATVNLTVGEYMEVVSPNGGEIWQPNLDLSVPIVWATNTTDAVSIELLKWDSGASDYVVVETLASAIPYDGDPDANGRATFNWSLPIGFTPGADYRVRVFSGGASWDTAANRDMGDADFRIMRVAYDADMQSDPGWTFEGQWAWGEPTGGGSADGVGNPDPVAGYTGSSVMGYNLDGNYANSMTETEYATFGPLDCTDFVDLQLTFRRWLGVERTDAAVIEISSNGAVWHEVWRNPTNADITDGDADVWELVSYDISEHADNQPTVWVRWGMGPTDATDRFCGWNLDDVAVHGRYMKVGLLRVLISPSAVVSAGAQWRRVGTSTWLNSGDTEADVPVGSQTVEFKDVATWIKPESQSVNILKNQTTTASGTYYQVGSLQVNISPADAVTAGAQWRRVGETTWRSSGYIESGINVGSYAVEFRTINGWHTPANQAVTVTSGQTTHATGTYERILYGSLQVLLSPSDAVAAGAQWRRAGTSVWMASGSTESDLPIGSYTIEFKTIEGWETPGNQSVTITENQTAAATANYIKIIQTGSLQVMIEPVDARMAGAQWRRVGTAAWFNSGVTEADVEEGDHMVEFKSITGWIPPADAAVTVEPDQTATTTGTYTKSTGALQVTIQPQGARDAGALWRRVESVVPKDDADDLTSGNVFRVGTPVLNGTTLEVPLLLFRGDDATLQDVLDKDGFFEGGPAPAAFTFDVVYDPNLLYFQGEAADESGEAASSQGIQPSDNLIAWYGHEVTVSEPDGPGAGRVRLLFADPINGNPVTTGDNVREGGDPEISENPFLMARMFFDCALVDGASSVHLLLENLAVTDGEQMLEDVSVQPVSFKVDKGSDWLPSGVTETDIPPGSYVVEFSAVAGWTAPAEQPVTITSGTTTTANGTYIQLPTTGSLTVTLTPAEAVAAGAQWRRQGTTVWFDSGSTESSVPAGAQNIEFKTVSGWVTPGVQAVTITAGEATTATGAYAVVVPSGSLQVTIGPAEAVTAGAQWRRTGTATWRNSGSTETGVPAGAHAVEFKAVTGWDKPANASVTVEVNQTAQVSATYTAQSGTGGCTLTLKALQPFVEVMVYEPVLPSSRNEHGVLACAPGVPLAIRMRSDEAIAQDSVWGVVNWGGSTADGVMWAPLDGGQHDGWVVYQPETPWQDNEVVTFTAGAYTTSGHEVGPFMYEFVVSSSAYDGPAAVVESGEAADQPEFVGAAYEILPDMVCLEPETIQLPVPEGVDASALEPAYLFVENGQASWVSGSHVAGWLEPGSVRVVDTADGVYVEFQVRHGGVVQLRRRVGDVSSAGMNGARTSGDLLLFLALGGFLVLGKRVRGRTSARCRQ